MKMFNFIFVRVVLIMISIALIFGFVLPYMFSARNTALVVCGGFIGILYIYLLVNMVTKNIRTFIKIFKKLKKSNYNNIYVNTYEKKQKTRRKNESD